MFTLKEAFKWLMLIIAHLGIAHARGIILHQFGSHNPDSFHENTYLSQEFIYFQFLTQL